jgi:hypothetical protein
MPDTVTRELIRLSPVFKTPEEILRGTPLLLDMVDDARVLVDREHFFAAVIDRGHQRLTQFGARRIWIGSAWYWDSKPDFTRGEVFEL